ncbi:hypothetical protein Tco_0168143 [Tanacetum coccineum]
MKKCYYLEVGRARMDFTLELMVIVLDLEKEKDAQAVEILKLKKIVKKLERQRKSSILHLRRRIYRQIESSDDDLDEEDTSKQGGGGIDKTKPIFKDSDFDRLDDDMENVEGETVYAATSEVSTAGALVSTARPTVGTAGPSTTATGTSVGILEDEMVTMADTLIAIRQTRTRPSYLPRPTLVVITDTEQEQRRLTTPPPSQPLDSRDKGKEYDTIQASIDADALFTARLQQEEIESSSPLKKEHNFCDFVPMDSEKEEKQSVEDESDGKKGKRMKRVVDSALKQKSSKKQKMMQEQESAKCDEDVAVYCEHEKEELRMWLTVVPDEEETVDLEILSANSYIADGWYFDLLQHVSREKVSSNQGNAGEDVELEARS